MLKIDQMYAFISVDKSGDEGVCAFYDSNQNMMLPMVGADMTRVEQLRPIAQYLASTEAYKGSSIKLVHFSLRTEVEEIR